MQINIDDERKVITISRDDGSVITRANIEKETETACDFTIPWSESGSFEELNDDDQFDMLNKTEGTYWKSEDIETRDEESDDEGFEEEEEDFETEDDEDQRQEEPEDDEKEKNLQLLIRQAQADARVAKSKLNRGKDPIRPRYESKHELYYELNIPVLSRNLIAASLNNDERLAERREVYMTALYHHHDAKDHEKAIRDIPDWAIKELKIEDKICKAALDNKFHMDSKFSTDSIFDCRQLIRGADRLRETSIALEGSHSLKSNLKRTESIINRLQDAAMKLLRAVDYPKYFNSEKGTIKTMGIGGHVNLVEVVVNARDQYRSFGKYNNKQNSVADIIERVQDMYTSSGLRSTIHLVDLDEFDLGYPSYSTDIKMEEIL